MKTHRGIIRFFISLALPAVVLFSQFSHAASPGRSAANFLKIGLGAKGAAMADAQAAIADDVTAAYWNPAGLATLRFKEISVMHYALVEGIRYEQAYYGQPTPDYGSFAVGFSLLDYGSIQGYDASSLPTGSVNARNLLLTGSWAKKLLKNSKLQSGASVKYLQSDLAGYKAAAPMLDLGVLYPFEVGKLRGLSLAAGLRNIGPGLKYQSESAPLPQQFVLGAGLTTLGGNLLLDVDAIKPNDNQSYLACGIEYRIYNLVALRAGLNGNSNFIGDGVTYGMGLRFDQWNIDYALVPYGDLGNTNRVSVAFRFGQAQKIQSAEDQVEMAYKAAQRQYSSGNGLKAYSMLTDLLLVAPWHQPSVELKAKIEKQFNEMAADKNRAHLDAEIAAQFTEAKEAFDRDELIAAKKGFETILSLQPDHVGSKVYLERIQNRYASLAHESYKLGMDYFAAGDYPDAIQAFEKTLTIDPNHKDAKAQMDKAKELMADSAKRAQEMQRLAGAEAAYKEGLAAYQKSDWEKALSKFEEVEKSAPEYEEVGRYLDLTKKAYGDVLFAESQVHFDNGQLKEAVAGLEKAAQLNPQDEKIQSALKRAQSDFNSQKEEQSKKLFQQGIEAYLNGDTAKAENLWKEALEYNPNNEDALQNLNKLEEQKKYEKSKQQ